MKSFSLEKAPRRLEMIAPADAPDDEHRYFEVLVDEPAEAIARLPPPPPLPRLPPEVHVSVAPPPSSHAARRRATVHDDVATVAPPVVCARALVGASVPPTLARKDHEERERRWKWRVAFAALLVIAEVAFGQRATIQQLSSRAHAAPLVRAALARLAL